MIKSLHIEHYALIDRLDINLHSGFSVITGETGAGKSIILGAIGLLLGERADTKSIKAGEKRCIVEAVFDLSNYDITTLFSDNDLDIEDDGSCIVRREFTAAGKSRAFINDTPVNLSLLKEIGNKLVDIHSQHQNLFLGKEDFQLNTLDVLSKDSGEVSIYKEKYKVYKDICKALDEAIELSRQNRDEEDYIRFQVKQLEDAHLQEGEQATLEEEQDLLSHAEEIKQTLYSVQTLLTSDEGDDILQKVKQCKSSLRGIVTVFPHIDEMTQRLESCFIELKDISDEIENKIDGIEFDPQRLEQVNDRLNTIYSLEKRCHLDTVEQLIALHKKLDSKLSMIDNSEEQVEILRKKKSDAFETLILQAKKLTALRMAAGKTLEVNIVRLLSTLGMPNVRFKVELTDKAEPDSNGKDKISFMFSANKNIPLQQLAQIASGGEIARVMLCLKALIADAVQLPTIIFDEIDAGVSGSIAEKMAVIMSQMGRDNRQIISITHLPQIAALGEYHYKVYKEEGLFGVSTHIIELTQSQRIEEIAHMLSGTNLTEAAINNARELLKQ